MRDVYDFVNMTKTKFSTSRVVLSGVLWRQDVSRSRKQQIWVGSADTKGYFHRPK